MAQKMFFTVVGAICVGLVVFAYTYKPSDNFTLHTQELERSDGIIVTMSPEGTAATIKIVAQGNPSSKTPDGRVILEINGKKYVEPEKGGYIIAFPYEEQ